MSEKPISPVAVALFGEIEREAQRRLNDAVQMAFKDANLPAGSKIDLQRGVWVLPATEEAKD